MTILREWITAHPVQAFTWTVGLLIISFELAMCLKYALLYFSM